MQAPAPLPLPDPGKGNSTASAETQRHPCLDKGRKISNNRSNQARKRGRPESLSTGERQQYLTQKHHLFSPSLLRRPICLYLSTTTSQLLSCQKQARRRRMATSTAPAPSKKQAYW